MTESRICATDRLRQEGRWAEASAYRDEVRKQLRADGKSRTEANDRAWEMMIEKHPPLLVSEDHEGDLDDLTTDLVSDSGDLPVSYEADARWVYRNLANRNATPDAAPNSGAWALLRWARDHRNHFFQQVFPKAISGGGGQEVSDKQRSGPDPMRKVIGNLLENLRLEQVEEIITDTPAAVRKQVTSALNSWAKRQQLNLSSSAEDDLVAEMCEIANECIRAALERPGDFAEGHCCCI